MKDNWIDKVFLGVSHYVYEDGTKGWSVSLFKMTLVRPKTKAVKSYWTLLLSLYDIIYTRDFADNPKDIKTISLLRHLLGNVVTAEVAQVKDAQQVYVRGMRYTITPYIRYSGYDNIKRCFKNEVRTVYGVTSPDDNKIPTFTFGPSEWDVERPSANEIINKAHELYDLTHDLTLN